MVIVILPVRPANWPVAESGTTVMDSWRGTAGHSAAVLEHKAAAMAMQRSSNSLDGDAAGRAFDACAGGQHLNFAGSFEIAVELVVDGHSAEGGILKSAIRCLGIQFYFNDPLACVAVAVPFWTGFGAGECDCV